MELTLSPNIEREMVAEIRARRRVESVPAFAFECVKLTARMVLHGSLQRYARSVVESFVRFIEGHNDQIANHLRWFPAATADISALVAKTGVPAGEQLRRALDDLIQQIDQGAPRLVAFAETLDGRTELGKAVHRSIRLMLEVKAAAIGMKRASGLMESADEITQRIEAATARMIEHHGRMMVGGAAAPDPHLLRLAELALEHRPVRPLATEHREYKRV